MDEPPRRYVPAAEVAAAHQLRWQVNRVATRILSSIDGHTLEAQIQGLTRTLVSLARRYAIPLDLIVENVRAANAFAEREESRGGT